MQMRRRNRLDRHALLIERRVLGLGAAPDDPQEFAAFVGDFAAHLVQRYTLAVVSRWRFRLGTECDGPRIGHSWLNFTAPNPPPVRERLGLNKRAGVGRVLDFVSSSTRAEGPHGGVTHIACR